MRRSQTWFQDGIVFLALLSVLLLLTELSFAQAYAERREITNLRHILLELPIRADAAEEDRQILRQMIDRLPLVTAVRMDGATLRIRLRNPEDLRPFLFFLQRPESKAVLVLPEEADIHRQLLSISQEVQMRHGIALRYLLFGVLSLMAVLLTLVQFVRGRMHTQTMQLRLAHRTGAYLLRIAQPFALEVLALLGLSFLLSMLLAIFLV